MKESGGAVCGDNLLEKEKRGAAGFAAGRDNPASEMSDAQMGGCWWKVENSPEHASQERGANAR